MSDLDFGVPAIWMFTSGNVLDGILNIKISTVYKRIINVYYILRPVKTDLDFVVSAIWMFTSESVPDGILNMKSSILMYNDIVL